MEVIMEIRVQSIKFDADQKLLDFIDKKVQRLSKFLDIVSADVVLKLEENHQKTVQIKLLIPGNNLILSITSATFEDSVCACTDKLKDMLVKAKEKKMKK